jgi:hypothetical protein
MRSSPLQLSIDDSLHSFMYVALTCSHSIRQHATAWHQHAARAQMLFWTQRALLQIYIRYAQGGSLS